MGVNACGMVHGWRRDLLVFNDIIEQNYNEHTKVQNINKHTKNTH